MATFWGGNCFLGSPYVLFVSRLLVVLVNTHIAFEDGNLVLTGPISGHCLLLLFYLNACTRTCGREIEFATADKDCRVILIVIGHYDKRS